MFELIPRRKENAAVYNPFRDMEEMERAFFGDNFFGRGNAVTPFKTDIRDTGKEYLLEADLPGFDKNDISIDLNGDYLTINAVRHSHHEEKDSRGQYVTCERSYGSYSRAFDMTGVETDNIKAKYENGVLTLTLPKKEETSPKSRKLEIE